MAAVGINYLATQVKTQPDTLQVLCFFGPEKALKNIWKLLRGNSQAFVFNRNCDGFVIVLHSKDDVGFTIGIFNTVTEVIGYHLDQPVPVTPHFYVSITFYNNVIRRL